MNIITYNLIYIFQRKSYEAIKKYKEQISKIEQEKKRLAIELKTQKELNEFNLAKLVDIGLQIESVKEELHEMRQLREVDRKELAHSTITIESLYNLIDEFLNRYPEVKLSEMMQSIKEESV